MIGRNGFGKGNRDRTEEEIPGGSGKNGSFGLLLKKPAARNGRLS